MPKPTWLLALVLLAPPLGALDLRLAAGASLHASRYPSVDDPLDSAPFVFGTAALDVVQDETVFVTAVAAGGNAAALDWEMVAAFRRLLVLDWGVLRPYLQAGIGWSVRSAGHDVIHRTALFPEAVIGIEATTGGPILDVAACYRPAPLPLPLLEDQQYPLRRFCIAVSARWVIARGAGEPGGRAR
jgi:hypothetical protein